MIKRFGFALAVAALAACAPLAAFAAPKAEAPKAYEKAQIEQGKKEAPAIVQQAGVSCTVADAAFVGSGEAKGADGKKVKQSVYEVACSGGMGYILVSQPGAAPQPFDCVTASGGSVACKLPENANPATGLQPILAATGKTCTIANARAMGADSKGERFYEVKCQQGNGYVLESPPSGAPTAIDCATQVGTPAECKLTTKDEIAASQKVVVQSLVAKSGKPCAISGSRYVGDLTGGSSLYEVACGATGFMLISDNAKGTVNAIDCAKAASIAGGCTLTNAVVAQQAEAGTYTKLANQAGFDCDVDSYRFIGMQDKAEVVELKCKNRPDGAVGIFTASNTPGKILDCITVGSMGQRCQLTQPTALYTRYTAALKAKGRTSCTVSDARWMGSYSQSNTDLVETACSDGAPGYVVEVDKQTQIKNVYSCGQAKSQLSASCQLATNKK